MTDHAQAKVVTEDVDRTVQTRLLNHMSWGAVFAGVAAALVTQLLLNMLGVGLGAASLDIGAGADNSGTGYSIGAGIWWVSSGIVAALLGGMTAGRLAGAARGDTAKWHGIVTWAVSTMLVLYLLSSAVGSVLGGAFNVLGATAGGVGKAAVSTATGVANVTDGDMVTKQVRDLVDPNGVQTVQDNVASYVRATIAGDKAEADRARARAVDGLARTANVSPQEAQARLASAETSARQALETAKVKATQAADATRKGVATAAILGFISLLLGAAAAWFGAGMGAARREHAALLVDARRTNG